MLLFSEKIHYLCIGFQAAVGALVAAAGLNAGEIC